MKQKRQILTLITIAIIIFSFLNVQSLFNLFSKNLENNEDDISKLNSAGYWELTAIHIDGNSGWASEATQPWCNGFGTWGDPYIIENVTINGQERDSCILIENSNVYFIIRNCTLFKSGDEFSYQEEAGIKLLYVSNGILINNNCSGNNGYGIYLNDCDNITISGNNINNNGQALILDYAGIYCINSGINNTIVGNTVNNNYFDGIFISSCEFYNISQNTVIDNYGIGIRLIDGINTTISHNNIQSSLEYGIYIFNPRLVNISNNIMKKCGIGIEEWDPESSLIIDKNNLVNGRAVYFYENETGLDTNNFTTPGQILLIKCNNSTLSNFNLSQTSVGLTLFNCKNITISNILANNCSVSGLKLFFSYNNTIRESSIRFNIEGINLWGSSETKIYDNNVTKNIWGLMLDNSHYNIINRNNLSKNEQIGIELQSSYHNNITNNHICNNKEIATNLRQSNFNIINNNTINNNINTLQNYFGIGISIDQSSNNTIIENVLSNNSYAGILLAGRNSTISGNNFTNCGLHFESYNALVEEYNSHIVDNTNLVNNKSLYFYKNKKDLNPIDFSDPGQIILVNCNDSDISNVKISSSTAGISLYYCKNVSITNNNLTENYHSGIHLVQSSYVNLSNNNASSNINKFIGHTATYGFAYGISLINCNEINLKNNNISNNGVGISIQYSINNNITGNNLNDNYFAGIMILHSPYGSCDNNNFTKNLMKNCSFLIYPYPGLIDPLLFIDQSNLVNNKPVYYYYKRDNLNSEDFTNPGQIILSSCSDSLISNSDISRCSIGVSVSSSNNITINNVNCSHNSFYGIMVSESINSAITDNIASENAGGGIISFNNDNTIIANNLVKDSNLFIEETFVQGIGIGSVGENITILGNVMTNNLIGLMASGMHTNVTENQIENNNQYGILMNNFNNGSFTRNNVKNNEIGISMQPNTYNDNNSIYYNSFMGNSLNAEDNGLNNKWDDGFAGNYWGDYDGEDADKNGIGDTVYSIRGTVYNKDNHPLIYQTDIDTDGEGLINFEEYVLGKDNYRTNVTNPDTDYDELSDYWEWKNSTNPWNPDTDFDKMPDGWEVFNLLNPIYGGDNITDADNDFLLNIYEYLNGTDPNDGDTDGDNFLDGIEVGALPEYNWWTDPLNKWWYPMPNLVAVDFDITSAETGKPFVLNITIKNDGIWDVENVTIIIWVEYLDLALFNNSANPIALLEVDEVYQDFIQSKEVYQGGRLVMELWIDPENLINETYSNKDGSLRHRSEDDNNMETILDVGGQLPGEGIELIWIIFIIIGVVAIAGITSSYVVLRPRMKRKATFKRQIETAKKEISNFESNIRSFIKINLKDVYESIWWDTGIPEYIRTIIATQIKIMKPKKPEMPIDNMDLLEFNHYSSIITYEDNWEQIFSKIFPDRGVVETNFENLRVIKRDLNEGTITREQLSSYPLFLHNITNYFRKGFNVFLSYSTLDTEYFNVKEVAKRLESYPQIDRVFFWEEDSGENIVTYMERTLTITKVFVFFCTENSVRSKAVEDEWQAAFQMRKKGLMKIVPVYENEDIIPFLLMPLLNVKYTKDDFDGFIQKLYEEILR